MGKIRFFFEMSRRERRGTVVVLVLIALMLGAVAVVHGWRKAPVASSPSIEQVQFDCMTDSVPSQAVKPSHKQQRKRKPAHRAGAKKKPAPKPTAPDPMTPVPQF